MWVGIKILITFIHHGEKLYGPEFIIYNIHVLSHREDVSHFGPLDNFSAFPFESHVKSLVKSSTRPFQQISCRIWELESSYINRSLFSVKSDLEDKTCNINFVNKFQGCFKKMYLKN